MTATRPSILWSVAPCDRHLAEVQALFAANERPEFPAWSARAYPIFAAAGAMSRRIRHTPSS